MGAAGSSNNSPPPVQPTVGNCKGILSGPVKLYQHCKGGQFPGWTVPMCPGAHKVSSNDFPADASHISVPMGMRAIIYTGIFNGRSKIIPQNTDFDFCSEGGWANDNIRSILIESVGDHYTQRFNDQLKDYKGMLSQINDMATNPVYQLPQKYKHDLMVKLALLKKENHIYREDYVQFRRRFLDANPHESVMGIGPFKTLDDRLLLLFWICFAIFVIPFTQLGINKFVPDSYSSDTKLMMWGFSVLGLAGIAQVIILCLCLAPPTDTGETADAV